MTKQEARDVLEDRKMVAQHYSNPAREDDPHALPDIETFKIEPLKDVGHILAPAGADEPLAPGWYWWSCFPGCLPDGDPIGPFGSETEALADAREGAEDDA